MIGRDPPAHGRRIDHPGQPRFAADRRADLRHRLDRGARLELAGRVAAVNLLDLSEGGAGVEASADLAAPGDEGCLVLDTAIVGVRVAAVAEGRIALAFTSLSRHALDTIRRIVAESPRPPEG
jgi:hypothetical protein